MLWLNAAMFVLLGGWAMVDAPGMLSSVGVGALSEAGWVELRAMYGGLEIGTGMFFGYCAARPELRVGGLWAGVCMFAGLGAVRLLGLAQAGSWLPVHTEIAAFEVCATVLNAALAVREGRAARADRV